MNPEKHDNKLTRWLLAATIALLVLVLGLQLWQLFGGKTSGGAGSSQPLTQDAAGPEGSQGNTPAGPALSPGKAAMIEDVRALNGELSADDLAKLSAEELEQLWETGAPGLPIGVSAAAQAAEEYAGTLELDSVTSETDPELDEIPAHYEVELHHPTLGDFEYKIDAYTGQVLKGAPGILRNLHVADVPQESSEAPAPESQPPAAGTQKPASGSPVQQPADDGEEAAKKAAFTHAGVSAGEVSSLRCKLEWDDGRQVYDIDFWVGDTEYDYKIEASTGVVLEAQQERSIRPSAASGQPGSFIGEEAAKSAAFAHAGVSASDAGSIQCKLDEEDGLWVYEVEFRSGGLEYDYEISASDGTVVKAEQDR